MKKVIFSLLAVASIFTACTQEQQNKIGRDIQNWTGTNGVLDIYMGEKLVQRYIKVDRISTATTAQGASAGKYRYGYGILDLNQNYKVDAGEKKLYFEISDYATPYVFYGNPN